jgi:2-polyprenyl-3-methyl-5-hydroxy-6-metoxy-1,4-benzoquinol methylase
LAQGFRLTSLFFCTFVLCIPTCIPSGYRLTIGFCFNYRINAFTDNYMRQKRGTKIMKALTPEMEALKAKLKATWISGDFEQIAKSYRPGAAEFVSRLNIKPGERVLDVACGTGNLAVPAAQKGAKVTGVDIAPNLLEQGRKWAKAEGLAIQFDEGDVEDLPYEDGSFDMVIPMFGAMFAPRPETTAAELIQVCRPGGRIAMANWTPTGFIGQMFKTVGKYAPPPAGVPSPVLWGDEGK